MASGGALASEPPRATGVGPEFHGFNLFPVVVFGRAFFSHSFVPFLKEN